VKELQEDLYFENTHNKGIIREGLSIVADGWQGSNEIVQALNTVHRLKIQKENESDFLSEEENDKNDENDDKSESKIQKLIQKEWLGSTILVSTNIFLELILNQLCVTCHDINPSNYKTKIRTIGLKICVTKKCMLCSDESEYYNERSGDDFSKFLAGADLVGGVNTEELRSIAEDALVAACEKLQSDGQDILENYVREASQTSGEIIFNGELEGLGYRHNLVLAYYVVEKNANMKLKMENMLLFKRISTILEKYNIKLNVGVDGNLSTNKTLALLNVVNQIFADLKYKIVNNPDLSLPTPNLVSTDDNQCMRLLEFLKKTTKFKENQSLIMTIRTSYNEVFNHLKLNYTEKKIDYPKSFRACHVLLIIHNNNGFIELQRKVRIAGNLASFSDQDEKNLFKIWKQKEQKRKNNLMAIKTHNKKWDLFPYGLRIQEELIENKFEPSFALLVAAFKSSSLKCIAYRSFQKKYVNGLCTLCGYLKKHNLSDYIPNTQYHEQSTSESILKDSIIDNTLTILKTGEKKSLIYAVISILSWGLTVIFTPQKALMDDQVVYNSRGLQFVIDEAYYIVFYKGFQ
ncbi:8634_t:CDS:10, partial [Funneliformis mosseae]